LRKTQLMELARLNGTLREGFEAKENSWLKPENQTITNQLVCTKCGGRGHISGDCMSGHTGNEKLVNRYFHVYRQILICFGRAMDSEYEALMSELGGGKKGALSQNRGGFSTQNYHGTASIQRVGAQ
jgi:splicing factor 1